VTSIVVAPSVMRRAHLKPRRAPSLIMVRLTGPTGIASSSALKKPVKAERTMGCIASIELLLRQFFLVFLFDFVAHAIRNTRANETVYQVERKERGQNVVENGFPPNDDQPKNDRQDDDF